MSGTLRGSVVKAKVVDIKKFGAFVKLVESDDEGFVHISKVSKNYVKDINDFLAVGQEIEGKVIGTTKDGKVELSMKDVDVKEDKKKSNEGFEKMMSKFMKESDKKMSEFRKSKDRKKRKK